MGISAGLEEATGMQRIAGAEDEVAAGEEGSTGHGCRLDGETGSSGEEGLRDKKMEFDGCSRNRST